MICSNILKQAQELVEGNRQEEYGDKLKNHKNYRMETDVK